ncbi:uncharacterized protein [Phyllobates terribilis]|uniref:uncharacterized protein n=1 Tax=Phyllobates terribilis TaxID=111132 RepID=UPI003CCB3A51
MDELFMYQMTKFSKKYDVVVMGDFNYPDICWESLSSKTNRSSKFLSSLADNFIFQKVGEKTRGSATLDLILINREEMVEEVKVAGTLGGSDHAIIEFWITRGGRHVKTQTSRLDFRKADFKRLRKRIGGIQWLDVLKDKNVQEGWEIFKNEILKAQSLTIPKSRKNGKHLRKPGWMNTELKYMLKRKKDMFIKWKEGGISKEDYNAVCRSCRARIRLAKADNELRLARYVKSNKKEFWGYVKSKRKVKDAIGFLQDENGEMVREDVEKAELFNSYFASVFSQKENVTSTDLHCPFKGIEESKLSVNRKIVREYLANINEFKSPGPDELHPRVLKEIVEEILEPLSIIFENSWRTGEVPEDWRRANVVPIFKKGKKVDPGNYRPNKGTAISKERTSAAQTSKTAQHGFQV